MRPFDTFAATFTIESPNQQNKVVGTWIHSFSVDDVPNNQKSKEKKKKSKGGLSDMHLDVWYSDKEGNPMRCRGSRGRDEFSNFYATANSLCTRIGIIR